MRKNEKWETLGYVGVDSGSLIIGDPCYLDDAKDWNPELYDKWIVRGLGESKTNSVQINEMCFNQAVAFTSGFGDGVYEVKGLYKKYKGLGKRLKEVKITLIDD